MNLQRDPRERDRSYLGWVARLPCVACMVHGTVKWGVHVAHLRAASLEHGKRETGKAEKPSDRWTLPLCPPHHTGDVRKVRLSQHDMDELDFWAAHGIDPFALCIELRTAYERHGVGVTIISKAAAAGRRAMEGALMTDEDKVRAQYAAGQAAGTIPVVAISIRQPWAWLIVNGWKDVENRTWQRSFRGPVLIHAGVRFEEEVADDMLGGIHPVTCDPIAPELGQAFTNAWEHIPLGGFVGVAEVVDCVRDYPSPWFVGPYGFILANAKPLPFLPFRGMLSFFDAKVSA